MSPDEHVRCEIVSTAGDEYAAWVRAPHLPMHPTEARKSYFICGTPRSGTWLLSGLLDSTGRAGRPHEYFWHDTQRSNLDGWRVSPGEYVARARDAGTTPNGIFGCSIKRGYLADFLALLRTKGEESGNDLELISRFFPNPHFVFVWREDVVAQAVSWAKALQSGYWHHWDSASRHEPCFDFGQVDTFVREVTGDNEAWRGWFAANDVEPLNVIFEDLLKDKEATTRRVLRFLGIGLDDVAIAEQTVRTGNALNAEWVRRYRDQFESSSA